MDKTWHKYMNKTSNMYKVSEENYGKLLSDNDATTDTRDYRKTKLGVIPEINTEETKLKFILIQ